MNSSDTLELIRGIRDSATALLGQVDASEMSASLPAQELRASLAELDLRQLSEDLANYAELKDLFARSAAIFRAGEESADYDEMQEITEQSLALADKMGV